jgi:hypothetical protein
MSNTQLIKEMVANGKRVRFLRYEDGQCWYCAENNLTFPVPVADVGSATLLGEDKALLFMRYIRKHLESGAPVTAQAVTKEYGAIRFTRYREGECWYVTETGFEFPVPVRNVAGVLPAAGEWPRFAEAILRHQKSIQEARAAQEVAAGASP